MSEQRKLSLSEAVTMYLAALLPERRQESQQELGKFVRWYGGERWMDELTALEVGNYGDGIGSSVADPAKKLEPVRSFLLYAKKVKLIEISLAPHVRVSKAKHSRVARKGSVEVAEVALTPEGHAALKSELEELKTERPHIAEELRRAAADKDFRENAPLEAARERQGQIEAKIRELEAILKRSTVIEGKAKAAQTASVGSTVALCDLVSGEQSCYILVSPSEANPAQGKLSIASPIGKALLDQEVGAEVEVVAPAGKLQYRIEEIKA
ncbi:MAG: transcription elongation factor GreA [Dehalococcoidia bacterium]